MTTRDHTVPRRGQGVAPPCDTHVRPRILVPPTAAEGRAPEQLDVLPAMVEVGELLRNGSTPRDTFGRLVQIIDGVFPVHAVAIVAARPEQEPLVWTSGAPGLEPIRVAEVARVALDQVSSDIASDELEGDTASPEQPWLSLPLAANDGSVVGLLAVAPAAPVDEATLAFVSCVATHLAALLVRGAHLERVFAARERTEWLSRASDLRLIEEQRARSAAEWSAYALGVASDATAVLLSSFDYGSVLRHVVRIVAEHLAGGCVVDVQEPDGMDRIAQVASHAEPVVARALAPMVAEVMQTCTTAASLPGGRLAGGRDPRTSGLVSERTRRALDVDWVVCVPMSTDGSTALGCLTMFGSGPRHAPIPLSIAEELGRRAAISVENGRRYRRAIAALQQREQVLSMVSHDLKNPLGVILMSVERVLEDTPEADRRHRGRPQLELIQRSARRMMKLVGDLLDLAALDAGQIAMSPRPCSVRAVVADTMEELGPQAAAAGVDLVNELSEELPLALADQHRITQVLTNLVGNAIKFTPNGGRVTARAALLSTREMAVSIEDTGIGIHQDHLEHVFDRFWQVPSGPKTGSGLGLAICRGILERAKGRIWAESAPGSGTTMTFTLPLAESRAG